MSSLAKVVGAPNDGTSVPGLLLNTNKLGLAATGCSSFGRRGGGAVAVKGIGGGPNLVASGVAFEVSNNGAVVTFPEVVPKSDEGGAEDNPKVAPAPNTPLPLLMVVVELLANVRAGFAPSPKFVAGGPIVGAANFGGSAATIGGLAGTGDGVAARVVAGGAATRASCPSKVARGAIDEATGNNTFFSLTGSGFLIKLAIIGGGLMAVLLMRALRSGFDKFSLS